MGSNLGKFITLENAIRLSGIGRRGLLYHVQKRHVRVVADNACRGRGGISYRYHVDDVRRLGWPGLGDIACHAGIDVAQLSWRFEVYNVPGAVKIGRRWRVNPLHLKAVLEWIEAGFPVRPGFTPKNDRSGSPRRSSHQTGAKAKGF